jgi:hypothetical protein
MRLLKTLFALTFLTTFSSSKLAAQMDTTTWKTVKENLFSLSYPKKNWQPFTDSITGATFTLSSTATSKKMYDKDIIRLRIMDNADKLYGDLDAYAAQHQVDKNDKTANLISAERVKKGTLEYHEKVEKNNFGKIKRRIKERYFFIHQKVYELTFDAEETFFAKNIAQVDSIFNSLIINDFAATTVNQWVAFDGDKYTLSYPSNWNKSEILPAHADFMLYVPKKSDDKGYWDNIYLMINTFKESTPELGSYAQRASEQLKTAMKAGTILQSTRKKTANFAYQEVISQGTLGKNALKMRQWHFVKGKKAYTLTYAARTEHYEDLMPIVNEIFNSFKLK